MAGSTFNMAKNKSNDRVIVLRIMNDKSPLSSSGLVDNRLFNGENNLHAVLNEETCMWYMRMDKGMIPPVFMQYFTSFSKLLDFVTAYYKKRNIEIVKVID